MREIDHQPRRQAGLGDFVAGDVHAGGVVVRLLAAAQDDVAVLVADGRDDGGVAGLGDRQEVVRRVGGADGIDGDAHVAVGAVLEADRAGQAGGQLTMDLGFGGAGADGTPGDQVGGVLRRDGVEELGGAGQVEFVDFEQDAPGQAQAFVDAEGVVETRVVDQPLPADGGARLFEIDAHDDDQVFGVFRGFLGQLAGVVHGQVVVVDRAGADHHQQAVVGAMQHAVDSLAGGVGGLGRPIGHRIFAENVGRRYQLLDFPDADVVGIRFVLRRHGLPHSKIAENHAFYRMPMEDFDPAPSAEIPAQPVKGRGAAGNVAHRFSTDTRQAEADGWAPPEPSLPQTRLLVDSAKSIISRNDSPDLGFDQSLNPYRVIPPTYRYIFQGNGF